MEMLDIYTDKFKHVGVASKKEAHEKGYWHTVITCLAINPTKGTAIFQRKYPKNGASITDENSQLDITVGGHIIAGESIDQAVREIKEELLEDVSIKDLVYLGIRQTAATINPNYIANEFQYIFLYPCQKQLNQYDVSGKEVARLVEIKVQDGLDLFLKLKSKITAKEAYIENGVQVVNERTVTLEHFLQCYQEIDNLFFRLLIAAKRYIDGENPKYIMW